MHIETERLLIRNVRPGDRDAVARLWSSPRVTRHLGGIRDRKAMRQALRATVEDDPPFDLWCVESRDTGKVVGHCGLLQRRLDGELVVEIIYIFGSRHWGHGYATEVASALVDHAFDNLGLDEVRAFIDEENDGSIRVAQKLGMTRELVRTVADGHIEHVWLLTRLMRTGM